MSKILYSSNAGIARVTLNRPEKRNAIDEELLDDLKNALRQAEDSGVRAILLTGAGADFCSGADLAMLQRAAQAGVMENMEDARRLADLFLTMRRHPRPIIAAVQGRALAGGCGLAMAADLILAAESAQFGYPEVNIGFVPAMVMALLRRSVSEKRAFELITLGETISAPQALAAGMINRVFADSEFQSGVESYAAQIGAKSASAVTLAKRLLYQMDGMAFEAALESGVHVNAVARMTDDCKQGMARFLKK